MEDQHESSLAKIQSQSKLNSTKGHPNTSRMVQDILARAKGLPTEGQYQEIAGQFFCLPDYSQILAWSVHFQITPEDLLGIFLDSSCCFGTSLIPHNHNFNDIAFRVESGRIINLPWDISKIGGAPPNEWIHGLEIKSLAVYGDCEGDVSSSMHDTSFSPNLPTLLYLVLEYPRNVIVDLSGASGIRTLMLKGPWFLDDVEQQSSYSVNMSKSAVTHLYCSNLIINSHNLSRHTCLIDLVLDRCTVDNLDLSSLSSLASFECLPGDFFGSNYHPLRSLNISSNTKLISLSLGWTDIESLDIRGLPLLRRLTLGYNRLLAKIAFDESNAVEEFYVYSAHSDLIGSAEFPHFKGVVKLGVRDSNAKMLNLKSLTRLEFLDCSHNNLTGIDLSSCSLLRSLNCQNNRIADLSLDSLPSLDTLICNKNQLSRLDLEPAPLLVTLDCSHNRLRSLDLANQASLRSLHCSNNQLTQIDLAPCTMLSHLDISENQLTKLDIRHCGELEWFNCELNELDKDHFFASNKIIERFVPGLGDIEELNLSVRAYNALKRHGVNKLQDLTPLSRNELLSIKGMNSKCIDEIIGKKDQIPWHFVSIQSEKT